MPTQLDIEEAHDAVEPAAKRGKLDMTGHHVAFDLDVKDASEAEQELGKVLAQVMTNELVQEAGPFVQERFESFIANLHPLVKKNIPNIEDAFKDDWMKENYFSTLSDFIEQKKYAFRPGISVELLSDADKQCANELHAKLQRANEVAVQEAVLIGFHKYCEETFDDVMRQAFSSDESFKSRLMNAWLSANYVATLSAFIDCEKFKPHACGASSS